MQPTLTRGHTWGARLLTLSGLPPLFVSTVSYALFMRSRLASTGPWQTLLGPLDFTLGDIRHSRPQVAAMLLLSNHVGWANLVTSGILLVMLSWFGVQKRLAWCWIAVLFVHLWTGANDLLASLDFGAATGKYLPLPVVPMSLGAIGLSLTARACWRN